MIRFTKTGCHLCLCIAAMLAGCSNKPASDSTASDRAGGRSDVTSRDSDSEDGQSELPTSQPSSRSSDSSSQPPLDAAQLHFAGMQALQERRLDEAYDYAREAMRLSPKDPPIIFLMATVLAERHRFPEAIQMLEELASTVPETGLPAMGQTADWLVRFGQWEKAESRYTAILNQMPDTAMLHRELAKLKLRQGRRAEAFEHLDRLCHLGDVTENELRAMLLMSRPFIGDATHASFDPVGPHGRARSDIAGNDWETARKTLEEIESPTPMESALLARSLVVLKDTDAVRSWLAKADPSWNRSPDAWFAKGSYASELMDPDDAIRCFVEAIRLDPTDQETHLQLAGVLENSGAKEEATLLKQRAELLEKTHQIGSQMAKSSERDAQSILMLGELMRQLGRPLESIGWRGVWLTYANETASISPSDLQQNLDVLMQERAAVLNSGKTKVTVEELLPGLNWAELPSVSDVEQRLKASVTDAPPE